MHEKHNRPFNIEKAASGFATLRGRLFPAVKMYLNIDTHLYANFLGNSVCVEHWTMPWTRTVEKWMGFCCKRWWEMNGVGVSSLVRRGARFVVYLAQSGQMALGEWLMDTLVHLPSVHRRVECLLRPKKGKKRKTTNRKNHQLLVGDFFWVFPFGGRQKQRNDAESPTKRTTLKRFKPPYSF